MRRDDADRARAFAARPTSATTTRRRSTRCPSLLVTNVMDLASTEFIFRGFLMLTLARVFGPIGLVVALFPFTFTHLTKPELELLSTFAGGAVYGWLTWRTGRSCGARWPTCTS